MFDTILSPKVINKLFVNIVNKGYLNYMALEFDESTNSIRKKRNNIMH